MQASAKGAYPHRMFSAIARYYCGPLSLPSRPSKGW